MKTPTNEPYNQYSHIGIKCGCCGHCDHIERFTSTPVGGTLPQTQYQCPACGVAWRIRRPAERQTWINPQTHTEHKYYPDHPDAIGGCDQESRLVRTVQQL